MLFNAGYAEITCTGCVLSDWRNLVGIVNGISFPVFAFNFLISDLSTVPKKLLIEHFYTFITTIIKSKNMQCSMQTEKKKGSEPACFWAKRRWYRAVTSLREKGAQRLSDHKSDCCGWFGTLLCREWESVSAALGFY